MKRFRCAARWLLAGLTGGLPSLAHAQASSDAALFLLLPVGARAAALGTAMVAQRGTADGMWWNPAGLASVTQREASLNHSQSLMGTGDALSVVTRSRVGTFGIGANLLQNDGGELTGEDTLSSGNLFRRSVALVGSYAVRLGEGMQLGASWKYVQVRFDCSGECPPNPTVLFSSAAFDVGGQFSARMAGVPVVVGLALRNLGTGIREGADGLDPARLHLGAAAQVTIPERVARDVVVGGTLDFAMGRADARPLPRVGAELAWADGVFLRGGYIVESTGSEAGGASLGVGFRVRQRLQVDFSRNFSGLSADVGQPPIQLAIRVAF
ncbi:MAG: hypothetical protein IPK85_18340 [Gemmatimonadetes bacterium]|nr:hypothetical protein [Gemmatimonadota bacterium]